MGGFTVILSLGHGSDIIFSLLLSARYAGKIPDVGRITRILGCVIDNLVTQIKTFILERGGSYDGWYVGISKNAGRRLFAEHCVELKDPTWIYADAEDSETARAIEVHFLGLGCDGG